MNLPFKPWGGRPLWPFAWMWIKLESEFGLLALKLHPCSSPVQDQGETSSLTRGCFPACDMGMISIFPGDPVVCGTRQHWPLPAAIMTPCHRSPCSVISELLRIFSSLSAVSDLLRARIHIQSGCGCVCTWNGAWPEDPLGYNSPLQFVQRHCICQLLVEGNPGPRAC